MVRNPEHSPPSKKRAPWTYRAYQSDTAEGVFGPMSEFVRVWRAKCLQSGRFPAWRDFDLMDFEGWWGQISLAEIQDDPFDLKWSLWGTVITQWWGADYTGQFISQQAHIQSVWENHERPFLERLIANRNIGYVSGTLAPQGREHLSICGVDLPLEDGGRVTHIMSAYSLCDDNFPFEPPRPPLYSY